MKILVTGGAGYIGSHAALRLIELGHDVVIVDNLTEGRGHHATIDRLPQFQPFTHFWRGDVNETDDVERLLREHGIEAVMHFAALAYVGESVEQPLRYFYNNVGGTLSLLRAMEAANVNKLIFSSTCSTYGEPTADNIPIAETCAQSPINPYGRSKLFAEQMIQDHIAACAKRGESFSCTALRYFNVAGSDPQGRIGECHDPETHLIPIALQHAAGSRDSVTVFGTDYDTADGTCVRDYVHVCDLVEAHVMALNAKAEGFRSYNVGIGKGYSVREVVAAVEKVTGVALNIVEGERRPGDPPVLFADAAKIRKQLGWQPQFDSIEPMIEHAWQWLQQG